MRHQCADRSEASSSSDAANEPTPHDGAARDRTHADATRVCLVWFWAAAPLVASFGCSRRAHLRDAFSRADDDAALPEARAAAAEAAAAIEAKAARLPRPRTLATVAEARASGGGGACACRNSIGVVGREGRPLVRRASLLSSLLGPLLGSL